MCEMRRESNRIDRQRADRKRGVSQNPRYIPSPQAKLLRTRSPSHAQAMRNGLREMRRKSSHIDTVPNAHMAFLKHALFPPREAMLHSSISSSQARFARTGAGFAAARAALGRSEPNTRMPDLRLCRVSPAAKQCVLAHIPCTRAICIKKKAGRAKTETMFMQVSPTQAPPCMASARQLFALRTPVHVHVCEMRAKRVGCAASRAALSQSHADASVAALVLRFACASMKPYFVAHAALRLNDMCGTRYAGCAKTEAVWARGRIPAWRLSNCAQLALCDAMLRRAHNPSQVQAVRHKPREMPRKESRIDTEPCAHTASPKRAQLAHIHRRAQWERAGREARKVNPYRHRADPTQGVSQTRAASLPQSKPSPHTHRFARASYEKSVRGGRNGGPCRVSVKQERHGVSKAQLLVRAMRGEEEGMLHRMERDARDRCQKIRRHASAPRGRPLRADAAPGDTRAS